MDKNLLIDLDPFLFILEIPPVVTLFLISKIFLTFKRMNVYICQKLLFTETKLVICPKVGFLLFPLNEILLDPILKTVKGKKAPPSWLISK